MRETERLGSTRIMTPVEPGVIALQYTDRWSAFDRGSAEQTIPDSGKARCACAVESFKILAANHLPTHFIRQVDDDTIHVQEFSVPGRQSLSGTVHGPVMPLEWLWRVLAFGSLIERIRDGRIRPEELGFPPGTDVVEGMALPEMMLECTTKFEDVDRHLSDYEARKLAQIPLSVWEAAQALVCNGVKATNARYEAVGLMIPDGKCELGLRSYAGKREVVFVDVLGTQDENRIIDAKDGRILSKDFKRNYLKSLPWYAELTAAKKKYPTDKSKWPPYPLLPDDVVAQDSANYKEVALRYAGVRI